MKLKLISRYIYMLSKRKHFNQNISDVFELLEIGDDIELSGSNSYKSLNYGYDYDLYEVVKPMGKTLEEAKNNTVKSFQNIFKEIKKNPNYYLMDFKCGLDKNGNKIRWSLEEGINGINKDLSLIHI